MKCNKNIVFPVIVIHTVSSILRKKSSYGRSLVGWSNIGLFICNPPVSSISPESSLEYFWARVPPAFRRLHLKQQETNTRERRMLTTETHTYITDLKNKNYFKNPHYIGAN